MKSQRLDYIDALRGFAVIGVLTIHNISFGYNNYSSTFQSLVTNGTRGVQLFYIISAFTLFLSYSNRKEESSSTINFFIRRFFRIAPLFYLAIIYYLWQDGFGPRYFLGDQKEITLIQIASTFSFLNQFHPYWINSIIPGGWSVAIEMTFYLIIPILFKYLTNINRALLFFCLSILLAFIFSKIFTQSLVHDKTIWDAFIFFSLPMQLPIFSIGIILYYLIQEEREISINIFILLFFLVIISFKTLPEHISFSFLLGLIVYFLYKYPIKIFVNKITCFIGKVSFGIYLCHYAILYWMNQFAINNILSPSSELEAIINYLYRLGLLIILSSAVAYLLHILIEKTGLKLGNFMINKLAIYNSTKRNPQL